MKTDKAHGWEFPCDGPPMIKRIMGSPGYAMDSEANEKQQTKNSTTPTAISRGIAHWRVAHWRVAHWRVKSRHLSNQVTGASKRGHSSEGVFSLAPIARIRPEDFGCIVFLGADVYAINQTGVRIMQYVQHHPIEDGAIDELSLKSEEVLRFVGELCSVGILVP